MFRPQFLGDKWPTVDFIVELLGVRNLKPFFFVQVRTTYFTETADKDRLAVQINRTTVSGLSQYPVPTYIVGVDSKKKMAYLVSANGESNSGVSSLCQTFSLDDDAVLESLWTEVADFWQAPLLPKLESAFVDPHWSSL